MEICFGLQLQLRRGQCQGSISYRKPFGKLGRLSFGLVKEEKSLSRIGYYERLAIHWRSLNIGVQSLSVVVVSLVWPFNP